MLNPVVFIHIDFVSVTSCISMSMKGSVQSVIHAQLYSYTAMLTDSTMIDLRNVCQDLMLANFFWVRFRFWYLCLLNIANNGTSCQQFLFLELQIWWWITLISIFSAPPLSYFLHMFFSTTCQQRAFLCLEGESINK